MKIKKLYDDWKGPFLFGFGIVVGLFGFSLILGVIFMGYDPMTMLEGIAQDFEELLNWGGF